MPEDLFWGLITLIVVVGGGGALYFFPSIVAYRREHRQREAILLLNLLLGWTLLGWIGALIWSVTASEPRVVVQASDLRSSSSGESSSSEGGSASRDPTATNRPSDDPDAPNRYEIG